MVPYLTLLPADAAQREHDLREVFNALRWLVRTGASWRMMPHDPPPWAAVYQQVRRWLDAGSFEAAVHDLRILMRIAAGRDEEPSAAAPGSRTLQSTPESGGRAGYDGAERRKGSKAHAAADAPGHLPALHVTPADAQDRSRVERLVRDVQAATGGSVELAHVDQGYTGERAAADARGHGVRPDAVKLPAAKHGFVLPPRRWVVERSFAWMARFRRLARDYERLATTLRGLHYVAFACVLLGRLATLAFSS